MLAPLLGRSGFFRALAGAVGVALVGKRDVAWSSTGGSAGDLALPLQRCGGAFCASYSIDSQDFRAVVDTGSPFLLVDGSCAQRGRFGCFNSTRSRSVFLGDTSEEGFGGEDIGVEWRRGAVTFSGQEFSPVNFGVVRTFVGKVGAGAIYLGLIKTRGARIRPTLLEQTEFRSMRFKLLGDKPLLTLSRRSLIKTSQDAVKIVDLRPLGCPFLPYSVKIDKILVNGEPVPLQRPCVGIIDTGTTGLSMSSSLYDSDELPLPGAAIRTIELELPTEQGRRVKLDASTRPRVTRQGSGGTTASSQQQVFPLVVTPVEVPWFEPGFKANPTRKKDSPSLLGVTKSSGTDADGGSARTTPRDLTQVPHVLFIGLAFLSEVPELTIDMDALRMTIAQPLSSVPEPEARIRRMTREALDGTASVSQAPVTLYGRES